MKMYAPAEDLFAENILIELREAVENYHGQELFIGGVLHEGVVTDYDILAKGNEHMAPVVFEDALKYDVVIHNHPSGVIRPSDADLEIASSLGNHRVGFYIVDNEYAQVNVVIAHSPKEEIYPLEEKEVLDYFLPGGGLNRHSPNYRERPSQLEMVKGIVDALNHGKILVCEAYTGTGKSLAYMIPAVFWNKENNEKIVISTNTIALQEQLVNKDLPLVKAVTGIDFKYHLVKGRSHFLCQKKFKQFKNDWTPFFEGLAEIDNGQTDELLQWGNSTRTGDKSELSFNPDTRLWDQLASESDTCHRAKCPFQEQCFYQKSRRKIFTADVLVVNHHVLCADASIKLKLGKHNSSALLPAFTRLVVDEAHNLEEVATSYFGKQASSGAFIRTLNLLARVDKKRKEVIGGAYHRFKDICLKSPVSAVTSKRSMIDSLFALFETNRADYDQEAQRFFKEVYTWLQTQSVGDFEEKKLRLTEQVLNQANWKEGFLRPAKQFLLFLDNFKSSLIKILEFTQAEQMVEKTDLQDVQAYLSRIEDLTAVIREAVNEPLQSENISWLQGKQGQGNKVQFSLNQAPLYVGEEISEALFHPLKTVVLTSATLKDQRGFDFFNERVGLNFVEDSRIHLLSLPPNFAYRDQCLVYLPKVPVPPSNFEYNAEVVKHIEHVADLLEGRLLVLFTSYSQMTRVYEQLAQTMSEYTILCQGKLPRSQIVNEFKDGYKRVLLGVASFWEGIDIPGKALSGVIVVKLPFSVPSEPLYEARVERMEAEGHHPFMAYAIPHAIIKFKQGFGRLIRSETDKGIFCVLDNRITEKKYGGLFLQALPDMKRTDSLVEVSSFFQTSWN